MTLRDEFINAARARDNTKLEQLIVSDVSMEEKCLALGGAVDMLIQNRERDAVILLVTKIGSHETALLTYSRMGEIELCKTAIAAGANINCAYPVSEQTALHVATQYNHIEIIKVLLEAHADVNAQAADARTALHFAVRNGSTDIINELVKSGADIFVKDHTGSTPLKEAALSSLAATRALLAAMTQPCYHPVSFSSHRMSYTNVQQEMLILTPNPNLIPAQLTQSLHFYDLLAKREFDAAESWLETHSLLLHFLIEGGTLHHYVVNHFSKAPAFLTKLLKRLNKEDYHTCNFNGLPPLHLAAQNNQPEVLAILLANGANPLERDNLLLTPLRLACRSKLHPVDYRLQVVKILRDAIFMQLNDHATTFELLHAEYASLLDFRNALSPALCASVDLSIPEPIENTIKFYIYMCKGLFNQALKCLAEHEGLSLDYTICGQNLYHYIARRFNANPEAMTNILRLLQSKRNRHVPDPYALDSHGKFAYEVAAKYSTDRSQLAIEWFAAKSHHALFQLLTTENSKLITKIFVEGFIPAHEITVLVENANNIAETTSMVLTTPAKQMKLLAKEIDFLFGLAAAAEDSLPEPLIAKLNNWENSISTHAAPSKLLSAKEHKKLCALILQLQNTIRALLRDNVSPAAAANIREDQKNIIVGHDFLISITNTSSNFFTMAATANIKPLICARHLIP